MEVPFSDKSISLNTLYEAAKKHIHSPQEGVSVLNRSEARPPTFIVTRRFEEGAVMWKIAMPDKQVVGVSVRWVPQDPNKWSFPNQYQDALKEYVFFINRMHRTDGGGTFFVDNGTLAFSREVVFGFESDFNEADLVKLLDVMLTGTRQVLEKWSKGLTPIFQLGWSPYDAVKMILAQD